MGSMRIPNVDSSVLQSLLIRYVSRAVVILLIKHASRLNFMLFLLCLNYGKNESIYLEICRYHSVSLIGLGAHD